MKKLLAIVIIATLVTPIVNASEIPETVCPYEYDFSNVESGSGEQDYITDVPIIVENYPVANEVINIDLYDWFGKYIEEVEYDTTPRLMADGMGYEYYFTGLVDGKYTFVINDTYKGTFNVNHELVSAINIDMGMYMQCYHDAYGNYLDPNTIIDGFYDYPQDNHDDDNYYGYDYNNDNDSGVSMTNIESIAQSETSSYSTTATQSDVENDDVVIHYGEQNVVFYAFSLPYIVIAILLIVIVVLVLVIYKLKKSRY